MHSPIHLPSDSLADIKVFKSSNPSSGVGSPWVEWRKRPGASRIAIYALGGGGGGGNGAIGANSAAGGGGGGGSGAQFYCEIPAFMIPDMLYVLVGDGGISNGAGTASRVAVYPDTTAIHQVAIANGGGQGGNGTTAPAGGTSGGGGSGSTTVPWATGFISATIAGQPGGAGGASGVGTNVTAMATALRVTGGGGGGGLGGFGAAPNSGGGITGSGELPSMTMESLITDNGVDRLPNGSNGYMVMPNYGAFYGGCGGYSTNGFASGDGLNGSMGGSGSLGCGGGGGGGALTGSPAGSTNGGRGGDGLVIIIAW